MPGIQAIFKPIGAALFSKLSVGQWRGARSLRDTISLLAGLLWLVPVIILFWLNFTDHVIGASVWCPFNACNVRIRGGHDGSWGGYDYVTAKVLDARDHDALGTLQLVGKALEIWFGFIAASLVYRVAQFLASSEDGIPVSMIAAHYIYADPLTFLDKSIWTVGKKLGSKQSYFTSQSFRLHCFLIFCVMICTLYNFTGPALTVLSLPTLRWLDQSQRGVVFGQFGTAARPHGVMIEDTEDHRGCTQLQLIDRNYSCTYQRLISQWDGMLGSMVAERNDYAVTDIYQEAREFIMASESGLSFAFNVTSWFAYAPTRQTLRGLSSDLETYVKERNYTGRNKIKSALNARIKREGPVGLMLSHDMLATQPRVIHVDDDKRKQIRCYNLKHYRREIATGWECITAGTGWTPIEEQAHMQFRADNMDIEDAKYKTTVVDFDLYTSAKGYVRFNSDSGLPACMSKNTTATECDWESDFVQPSDQWSPDRALYAEISTREAPLLSLYRYYVWSTFATHTVDSQNPIYFVETSLAKVPKIDKQTQSVNYTDFNGGDAVMLHPDWFLAVWSMDKDEVTSNDRGSRRQLVWNVVHYLMDSSKDPTDVSYNGFYWRLKAIMKLSGLQALSLVPWSNETTTEMGPAEIARAGGTEAHPVLKRWITVQVWAFGLGGRTAVLGVVVASIGMFCTLLRTILCVWLGTQRYGVDELFVSAIKQPYRGELDGIEGSDIAKARFQVVFGGNRHMDIKKVHEYRQLEEDKLGLTTPEDERERDRPSPLPMEDIELTQSTEYGGPGALNKSQQHVHVREM